MNDRFSKIGFVLSIVGAAIGLGNAWKFPYMVGENGGSAFVFLYLIFAIIVGLSIFFAEIAMGRLSRMDVVGAFRSLAPRYANAWGFAGIMVITGILIASFYTLIIGWVIKYAVLSFGNLPADTEASSKLFGNFVSKDWSSQVLYFSIAFFSYFMILSKGVKRGIERINLWLVPILFVLLIVMLIYSMGMNGFTKAYEFLLIPDFSKIDIDTTFKALGLAFFTMCIGIGAIITYSASLSDDTNLFTSSLYVILLNIVISIIIGLIVFTFVFEFNEEPLGGVGLAFISLPTLFAKLGFVGHILCFVFFIALVFAGLTSAISMVEPCIYYLSKELKVSRFAAILMVAIVVYILGILCLFSNIDEAKDVLTFAGKNFFDWLDYISSNVMLPIGGILIAIFVGFFVKKQLLISLFVPYMGEKIFKVWYFLIRYVAPICVLIVLIRGLL